MLPSLSSLVGLGKDVSSDSFLVNLVSPELAVQSQTNIITVLSSRVFPLRDVMLWGLIAAVKFDQHATSRYL